jgi:hypothetical protein
MKVNTIALSSNLLSFIRNKIIIFHTPLYTTIYIYTEILYIEIYQNKFISRCNYIQDYIALYIITYSTPLEIFTWDFSTISVSLNYSLTILFPLAQLDRNLDVELWPPFHRCRTDKSNFPLPTLPIATTSSFRPNNGAFEGVCELLRQAA